MLIIWHEGWFLHGKAALSIYFPWQRKLVCVFHIQGEGLPTTSSCCCLVTQLCPPLCDPMDCSTPGLPVSHYLLEFAQTHVHCTSDVMLPFHLQPSLSLLALILSQHQGLFKWVGSLYQAVKVLELQHQLFQWIFRVNFLESKSFDGDLCLTRIHT